MSSSPSRSLGDYPLTLIALGPHAQLAQQAHEGWRNVSASAATAFLDELMAQVEDEHYYDHHDALNAIERADAAAEATPAARREEAYHQTVRVPRSHAEWLRRQGTPIPRPLRARLRAPRPRVAVRARTSHRRPASRRRATTSRDDGDSGGGEPPGPPADGADGGPR